MKYLDEENFITSLIWSGLIDNAKCGELKKIIEQCEVEAIPVSTIENIKNEIWTSRKNNFDKAEIVNLISNIKAEIETEKESMIEHNGTSDLGLALEIINNHWNGERMTNQEVLETKYNQGFYDGYKQATEQANTVIDNIKTEITNEIRDTNSETEFAGNAPIRFFNKGIRKSLSIINKHIRKENSND